MNVDQGTVSRWERNIESPRPARAAALRDMILRDEDERILARSLAIVRCDLMSAPVSIVDPKLRVSEMSQSGIAFMRRRGYDPKTLIGQDVHRWSERLAVPDFPRILQMSGLMSGEALLLRFVRNDRGRGHVTVYEPIFSAGKLVCVFNYVPAQFDFAPNDESTVELVEVVGADDPGKIIKLHAGARSEAAISAVRG